MTDLDGLFEIVTKIIASPHTDITEKDKRRAIQVFLGFDDYLIDALPGYCEEGCEIDFGGYAAEQISELEEKGTPITDCGYDYYKVAQFADELEGK